MSQQIQVLELYLKKKFVDKTGLSIIHIDKLADGWESNNYLVTVEYDAPRTYANWVLRIFSGVGNQEKAAREFDSMKKLFAVGYPVPQVILLETEHSPVGRPFIIMEYVPGETMWEMLEHVSTEEQEQLIDQFCQLFVKLHALDWKRFDDSLPDDDPFYFIDLWLDEARRVLHRFPEVDATPILDWVIARREVYACTLPSPVHQDFHPGNILIKTDRSALVIDWTNFDVTDFRFDLAWTLVLADAYGGQRLRDQIFLGYQHHARKTVEQIEAFEAIASARRLLDISVSLTQGSHMMGMNAEAREAMLANMRAHQRVYRLFLTHTALRIRIFEDLFGSAQ